MNFWQQLPKPFFSLAPMEDVTDAAFRLMFAKYGKPDVLWTEFTSADGIERANPVGKYKLLKKLEYAEIERPIVAQVFTANIEVMERTAALCAEMGFDGMDINMGCPDKSVERQGCGSALIRTPDTAVQLVRAALRGAGTMPVSVKTRLGYNEDTLEEWLPVLLAENPAAITLHARTRKDMSLVPARWERVARAVQLRDTHNPAVVISGNGDVLSVEQGLQLATETGCDGVMVGRGAFGNPWFFGSTIPTQKDRVRVLAEHIQTFDNILGEVASYSTMKKHFKAYIKGWDGAKELRDALMLTTTAGEAIALLQAVE
jgi:nifR3 family TIM-barrel protein